MEDKTRPDEAWLDEELDFDDEVGFVEDTFEVRACVEEA